MKNGKFEKKDLDKLNEIYKDVGPMTCNDFKDYVDDLIELTEGNDGSSQEEQETVEFWNIVRESLFDANSLFIYDVKDKDGFAVINDIMKTLHYDNGMPLSCNVYDYFDNYDRDQDLWGFYEDELIDHFKLDRDGNLIIVMVMNKEELTDKLTDLYDGSSWDHDFGDYKNKN